MFFFSLSLCFFPKLYFMRMNYVQHTLSTYTPCTHKHLLRIFFSLPLTHRYISLAQSLAAPLCCCVLHFYMDLACSSFFFSLVSIPFGLFVRYVASHTHSWWKYIMGKNFSASCVLKVSTKEKKKRKKRLENQRAEASKLKPGPQQWESIKRNKSFSCFDAYIFSFHVSHSNCLYCVYPSGGLIATTNGITILDYLFCFSSSSLLSLERLTIASIYAHLLFISMFPKSWRWNSTHAIRKWKTIAFLTFSLDPRRAHSISSLWPPVFPYDSKLEFKSTNQIEGRKRWKKSRVLEDKCLYSMEMDRMTHTRYEISSNFCL